MASIHGASHLIFALFALELHFSESIQGHYLLIQDNAQVDTAKHTQEAFQNGQHANHELAC